MKITIDVCVWLFVIKTVGLLKEILGLRADDQTRDVEVGPVGRFFNDKPLVFMVVTGVRLCLVLAKDDIPIERLCKLYQQLELLGWQQDCDRNIRMVFPGYKDTMPSWFWDVVPE